MAQIEVKRIHVLDGGLLLAQIEVKRIEVLHDGLVLAQIEVKRIHVLDGGLLLTSCRFFGRDFLDWFIIDFLKQGGLFILVLLEAGLEFSFTFRVTRQALCFGGFRVEPRRRGGPDLRQR